MREGYEQSTEETGLSSKLPYLLIGGCIGVVIGLLIAARSGREKTARTSGKSREAGKIAADQITSGALEEDQNPFAGADLSSETAVPEWTYEENVSISEEYASGSENPLEEFDADEEVELPWERAGGNIPGSSEFGTEETAEYSQPSPFEETASDALAGDSDNDYPWRKRNNE